MIQQSSSSFTSSSLFNSHYYNILLNHYSAIHDYHYCEQLIQECEYKLYSSTTFIINGILRLTINRIKQTIQDIQQVQTNMNINTTTTSTVNTSIHVPIVSSSSNHYISASSSSSSSSTSSLVESSSSTSLLFATINQKQSILFLIDIIANRNTNMEECKQVMFLDSLYSTSYPFISYIHFHCLFVVIIYLYSLYQNY